MMEAQRKARGDSLGQKSYFSYTPEEWLGNLKAAFCENKPHLTATFKDLLKVPRYEFVGKARLLEPIFLSDLQRLEVPRERVDLALIRFAIAYELGLSLGASFCQDVLAPFLEGYLASESAHSSSGMNTLKTRDRNLLLTQSLNAAAQIAPVITPEQRCEIFKLAVAAVRNATNGYGSQVAPAHVYPLAHFSKEMWREDPSIAIRAAALRRSVVKTLTASITSLTKDLKVPGTLHSNQIPQKLSEITRGVVAIVLLDRQDSPSGGRLFNDLTPQASGRLFAAACDLVTALSSDRSSLSHHLSFEMTSSALFPARLLIALLAQNVKPYQQILERGALSGLTLDSSTLQALAARVNQALIHLTPDSTLPRDPIFAVGAALLDYALNLATPKLRKEACTGRPPALAQSLLFMAGALYTD